MYMRDTLSAVIDGINRAGALHWDFASAMFVQAAFLVVILAVVEVCLRRRVRPVVRYWLWALVILKLMLPVALRTPASLAYWVRSESQLAATLPISVAEVSPAFTPLGTPQDFDTRPLEELAEGAPVDDSLALAAPQLSRVSSIRSDAAPAAVALPHPLPAVDMRGWLLLAWCGGCLVLGGIVFRRAAKVRRLVREAGEAPREFGPPLEVACSLLQLSSRRMRVKISEQVGCPAVCGFWRPTILIPQRLMGRLDDEQLQLVLVHELAHWKRWDLQFNLLQTVLQVVYFYNPAVWIANSALRRLREEAVDDAVLVTLGARVERYSHTLLDVAAHAARSLEMNVRLIGILESRKALANRIQRLATSPLPTSARLGLWGFAGVVIIGLALLPMAGSRRVIAENPVEKPAQQAASPSAAPAATEIPPGRGAAISPATSALTGRVSDEQGRPVSDAIVRLMNVANRNVEETATNGDGQYAFAHAWFTGEHAVFIHSDRCLGFTSLGDCPRVVLDAKKPVVRDFQLKLACQLRVQTVDEAGHPVPGVRVFKAEPNNPYQADTDGQGWMTIGGLAPAEYLLGLASKDFVPALLIVKIDAPKSVVERKVVLKRGTAIKGTSFYSDGKPVVGGRVIAIPGWWQFNLFPFEERVQPDGTFVLPHIGSGTYDVTLTIPGSVARRPQLDSFARWPQLDNVDLVSRANPLVLNIDGPSPGALVRIKGHLHFIDGKPRRALLIIASASDRSHATLTNIAPDGQEAFEVGPLPAGK
jgi:beta-lactamase regulating signal transducer with metallopeptidase domain